MEFRESLELLRRRLDGSLKDHAEKTDHNDIGDIYRLQEYGVCRLLVLVSGVILGILSGITLVAAAVLFFKAGVLPGVAFLAIAFLISPYGLPRLAAWLTGKIGGINYALRDFLAS